MQMNIKKLIDAANQLQTDCDNYHLKVQAQEKEIKELKERQVLADKVISDFYHTEKELNEKIVHFKTLDQMGLRAYGAKKEELEKKDKEIIALKTEITRLKVNGTKRLELIYDLEQLIKKACIKLEYYKEH